MQECLRHTADNQRIFTVLVTSQKISEEVVILGMMPNPTTLLGRGSALSMIFTMPMTLVGQLGVPPTVLAIVLIPQIHMTEPQVPLELLHLGILLASLDLLLMGTAHPLEWTTPNTRHSKTKDHHNTSFSRLMGLLYRVPSTISLLSLFFRRCRNQSIHT